MHDELRKATEGRTGAVSLRVKVIPKSARTEIAGALADGTIKIKLAAVPEKGKANAELCAFLAREFGVARDRVEVVTGATSPQKLVRITR
jgi:uncharacterized protein (TIGR00251 family)